MRLHPSRPVGAPLAGAGASAVRAGGKGALPPIVERRASHQSTMGDALHANESLQPTALSVLPCEWLASASPVKHLVAWTAARRS